MTADPQLAGSIAGATDTIVALATPPGRGAISVVRLSGPDVMRIAETVIHPWPLEPRRATLCRISDAGNTRVLDQALVTTFVSPDSFTGEDLIEISGHGGQYAPALLMDTLVSCGARPALPGEFSRRAVLNGKLDITQAEAIGDLVEARSAGMHRSALQHLDGGLSRRIAALRKQLLTVESLIAYDIDFPEEDDGPLSRESVSAEVEVLLIALDALLATVPMGEIMRDGAIAVIAGKPNVGKSSLFNALLGHSRAIVTDVPGTTRDAIESFLETDKWPLRLVDTAGLRETEDTVERIGIEVSERYLGWANIVLACGDDSDSLQAVLEALDGKTRAPVLKVQTKSDLGLDIQSTDARVSAETGEGLKELLSLIDETLAANTGSINPEMPILTRSRHIQGLRQARTEVGAFADVWREGKVPATVAAVHLRTAGTALESLIGAISTDDVLDRVFSSFCVGK